MRKEKILSKLKEQNNLDSKDKFQLINYILDAGYKINIHLDAENQKKLAPKLLYDLIKDYYDEIDSEETTSLLKALTFLSQNDRNLLTNIAIREGTNFDQYSAENEALVFTHLCFRPLRLALLKRMEITDYFNHIVLKTASIFLASLIRIRKVMLAFTPKLYYTIINRAWNDYKIIISENVWNL